MVDINTPEYWLGKAIESEKRANRLKAQWGSNDLEYKNQLVLTERCLEKAAELENNIKQMELTQQLLRSRYRS